jgi:hypothetical protein
MSADNGIYILKTQHRFKLGVFEWRVAECTNSENFTIDTSSAEPLWNLPYVWNYFSKAEVHVTNEAALQQALALYEKCTICEYGIRPITMDQPFPTREEAATMKGRLIL